MLKPTEKIWHNGRFIPWQDATIHVLSHVVNYGSSVFEGIRCYSTPSGPAIFRLREHIRRMMDSAKIYRMDNLAFTPGQLADAMLELVRVNKMDACYLRPIMLRGYGEIGVYGQKNPIDIYIACWEWGKYLGEEALAQGVDVCVSSWNRMAPNTLPALAKASANYMNSQLMKMEPSWIFSPCDECSLVFREGWVSGTDSEPLRGPPRIHSKVFWCASLTPSNRRCISSKKRALKTRSCRTVSNACSERPSRSFNCS